MSLLPPKRKSKELMNIDAEGFRLLIESSQPEFWAVEEEELKRRNDVLQHELNLLDEMFYKVSGRK